MNSDEIRDSFLAYFAEQGHLIVSSSPLVPQGDPTLLLTNAGMVQFKPYFTGEATPPRTRLTSVQKCFRTTDIDSVGDSKHLTFFEMLGNFSFGDYFKKEAIEYAWEFVTKRLGIPEERLWATVFLDDDEAFDHWVRVGVPTERIRRYGEKDNFWGPAGDSGPCGPSSEIHYDFGEDYGCGEPDCGPACDCPRFLEIWNLVFTQYFQDTGGKRTPLAKKNIDTGMGLERVAAVMQGKITVYETDVFTPLIETICRPVNYSYGSDEARDKAVRIVVEHSRGVTFLISDGVIPSNEGRGYVLRRILRRALLYGKRLGIEPGFLDEVIKAVIGKMGHVYPEIVKNQDLIFRVTKLEEDRFEQTLAMGLGLLEDMIAKALQGGSKVISGKDIFRLYDTYGFPAEVTAEVAAERGLQADLAGFEATMEEQRERARAAHKFGARERVTEYDYENYPLPSTQFVGYHQMSSEATVLSLAVEGRAEGVVSEGQKVEVVLDKTPFYAEAGGQVGDTGKIIGKAGIISVRNTVWARQDLIVHIGTVESGQVFQGEKVNAEIDTVRRLDIARNHTGTHLLHAALRKILGPHVRQSGSVVAPDRLRFDFSHLSALSSDDVLAVQRQVNEWIRQNLSVTVHTTSYAEAVAIGALAFFEEKYGDQVRVMEIGSGPERVSAELCGGTHLSSTGEIGLLLITSESSIGAGLRRVEAVTGRGAEQLVEEHLGVVARIARQLRAAPDELADRVSQLLDDLENERRRVASLQRAMSKGVVESLLNKVTSVDGVKVIAARVDVASVDALREMGDELKARLGSGVIVLGTVQNDRPNFVAMVTPDLAAKGLHAGEIVKKVAQVTGGGGGGRAEMGQAGGKDKTKLNDALMLVPQLVRKS